MKTTQMPIIRKVNGETVAYVFSRILLSTKKEKKLQVYARMGMNLKTVFRVKEKTLKSTYNKIPST